MSGIHDHPDNRGVFVELWIIDLLDGDLPAALLFSQLLWWHQTSKDGTARVRYERDGDWWLVRADDAWQEDCRLTQKQVRRVKAVLVDLGFVSIRRFKVDGAPTTAWRPMYGPIQAALKRIRPNPELPSEGQFQGSDPQGVVPIPSSPLVTSDRARVPKKASAFPDEFRLTPAMKEWAAKETPSVDLVLQTKQFADHWRSKGERRVDWVAGWRTWMRNAVSYGQRSNGHAPVTKPLDLREIEATPPDPAFAEQYRLEREAWMDEKDPGWRDRVARS